jgi:hypothetical protein
MPPGALSGLRVLVLALLASVVVADAAAQSGRPLPPTIDNPAPSDFMLGRPKGFIAVDGGFLFANAGSDVYDFITDRLTLEKKSFNTPVVGGRLGWSISPRVDAAVIYEQGRTNTASEYRDFIDNRGDPITQTTERQEYHVAASVRWSLVPSGRSVSRFAWIPRRLTPYVGGGAGAIKYVFRQYGSFVDFQTSRVFNDTFASEGWAPAVHAVAGTDVRVFRKLYLSGEGRYTWSKATLGQDFVDFDPISLAGLRMGGSLKIVF